MPVYKYKTFEEAESALWNFHPNAAYFNQVAELWKFANQLCPITYPQGIFKYRSIEEANQQRDEWELAHAKRVQERIISSVRKQKSLSGSFHEFDEDSKTSEVSETSEV
ncbi:hypothetical protein HYR99_41530 [Candidatus Poribacteria bacterium]|nr:hypothetical protein [Candidatus Poribacteria bacterium]